MELLEALVLADEGFRRIKANNDKIVVQIAQLMELQTKAAQWNEQREHMLTEAVELLRKNTNPEIEAWLANNGFNN
jgi:hypothetical protein